ncbi:MAG: GTP-binding protein [Mariprofundus sp.]
MRIKVFSAPHLHEALAKVRQEMGPDALILDRQQSSDASGTSLWHVHAALDNSGTDNQPTAKASRPQDDEQDHSTQSNKPAPLSQHADSTLHRLERIVEGISKQESSSLRQSLPDAAEQEAFDHLTQLGIKTSHAFDMASDFAVKKPLGSNTVQWGKRINPEKQRSTLLFTGPSGCGKSTLVAKLAAHYSMKGIRVAILSTDTERIGGTDTLKAYADMLGIDFHPLKKATEVKNILANTQTAQLLLIDTEGWSPRRDTSLKRQSVIWDALGCDRRFLMIPATMDEEDGMQQLKHSAVTEITDIAFSRLDETQKPGKIVNWSIASFLPMSYCSFGPEVPEQMGWLNARALTTLLSKHPRGNSA